MSLTRSAAITGFAEMPSIKRPGDLTPMDIASRLSVQAVADAGLEKGDIDGLLALTPIAEPSILWPTALCESLQLNLSYFDSVDQGGASSAGMILRAAAAVHSGICNHVLCVGVDVMNGGASFANILKMAPASDHEFELPYGNTPPLAGYGMIANRHMHEYGTTAEQLAKVAVDQRFNALHTPEALFNDKPLSADDVLASPMICSPLHLTEIVSPCSGGAAVVVSRADATDNCPHNPVKILGVGEAGSHTSITYANSLTHSWIQHSSQRAFAMAGMNCADIDCVQLYDCFPITLLLTLEDMGFCDKGIGGEFIAQNDLTWQGNFPCNTNGGQLSFGQAGIAGGMCHITEATRQLMGRADSRQINNATTAVAHGNGGIMGEQVSLILGLE
jgi:acetyl-CoA C-acetyltransferase